MSCDEEDELANYLTDLDGDNDTELTVLQNHNVEQSINNNAVFINKTMDANTNSKTVFYVQNIANLTSLPVSAGQVKFIAENPIISKAKVVKPLPQKNSDRTIRWRPSSAVSSTTSSSTLCMSKSAVTARENRQKKKSYFGTLESAVQNLKKENVSLKSNAVKMNNTIDKLNEEIAYLKSVVANQSALSSLLNNICNTSGVNLTSSISQNVAISGQKENHCGKDTVVDVGCVTRGNKRKSVASGNKNAKLGPRLTATLKSKRSCDVGKVSKTPNILLKKVAKIDKVSEISIHEKNPAENDISIAPLDVSPFEQAGICLHVSGGSVSLEFCAYCSKNASLASKSRH